MKTQSLKQVLLGTTLLVAMTAIDAGVISIAAAQEAAGSEIVVTGTRIQRPGFNSASPIASIGADEIAKTQPTDVEQMLRQMPQFVPSLGAEVNNGSAGASTVDLRGLSAIRTLPLIDGKRVVGFDPNGQFDVAAVPIALLKRVDVVTGGASAVYGSDAVAGVVNFILNDEFQGVQADAGYSITGYGDGETDRYAITMGTGFDAGKGSAVLSLGYVNREPVYQVHYPATKTPGASSFTTPAYLTGPGGKPQVQPDGTFAPTAAGSVGGTAIVPLKTFDFNPYNLYQTPNQRWNALALAKYDLTSHIQAYSRFIYQDSTTNAILAPSLLQGDTLEIPLSNPFLTAQARTYLQNNGAPVACSIASLGTCVSSPVRWRALAVGPRTYVYNYNTFQALVGFRGDFDVLGSNWKWDLAGAHGETNLKRQQNNDFSSVALQQAILTNSATSCAAGAPSACVPLNFFNPSQPVSKDAISFISLNLQLQAVTKQDYVTGSVSGDLGAFKSPFATSAIGVSFGAEYRGESTDYQPDNASIQGISPGFGQTLPIKGRYDVKEEFIEALIPLVEDKPGIKSINFETGFRNSDYSTSGTTHSYKAGADYSPFDGLRFRGMYDRAVRAANLSELFSPVVGQATADAGVDPCAAGASVTGALRALCIATRVPVAVLNNNALDQPTAGQVSANLGGSAKLKPETADTYTFGVVFQPDFIKGLGITVDYYDIKIADAVAIRPAQDIINGCYNLAQNTGASATYADCLMIHRNPLDGTFNGPAGVGVDQINANIAEIRAKGIDYGISYRLDLGPGALQLALNGTHVNQSTYVPTPGAPTVECAGFYGKACSVPSTLTSSAGGPTPKDHFTQRTSFAFNVMNRDIDVGYNWRHLSSVKIVPAEVTGTSADSIKAFDYLDLDGSIDLISNVKMRLGVINVFKRDPPLIPTGTGSTPYNSGNTYPSTYDVLGRVYQVGFTAKF